MSLLVRVSEAEPSGAASWLNLPVVDAAKTDGAFKRFLDSRNPTNQHSASLESYLIKPVQRVLKYPLLLRELVSLTAPESPEHQHLTGETVAHTRPHGTGWTSMLVLCPQRL